ncbi:uncharacterized protein LOC112600399 [Melanaphis sacchari]|uniref:uncharacterized protein LOC112600399 n=1 Tax=Melanaphis sacchari TaxID=742174 RepID=UPI000DC153B2|nr:uncharacterized protein LOC112600399 [Melanaphis sacchari]
MVKIQFSVKNAVIQKYTIFLTVVCLVMTFMNMMNRIHYIGASYALGAILMGITNHIHNALTITGIGCILDMLHLISRNYNSSWASVRYFQCIINILAIVYELMYMIMLHCYWQYTEAAKIQPQTSWLKNQTILPIKLGRFGAAGVQNPSVSIPQNVQTTEPDSAMKSTVLMQESNAVAQNSITETSEVTTKSSQALTKLNVTIPEENVVSEPTANIESSETAELSVAVSKPTVSSTEPNEEALNSIVVTPEPIETTEPGENATELNDALADFISPVQESNSAVLDSETQKPIEAIESKPTSESDKKASEKNIILMEPDKNDSENNVTQQQHDTVIPVPNEEKQ